MSKTAIVYYSNHHGNTKKVLEAIKEYDDEWTDVLYMNDVSESHHWIRKHRINNLFVENDASWKIYCINLFDDVLALPILPSIDEVINCLARKHKWIICPTGNAALNIMGLSTQVPASYTYLSSGPYKEYLIYETPVSLKRSGGFVIL